MLSTCEQRERCSSDDTDQATTMTTGICSNPGINRSSNTIDGRRSSKNTSPLKSSVSESAAVAPRQPHVLKSQEVGFALLELRRLTEFPWLEILITANDNEILEEDVEKMLAFISDVLFSEQACDGFGLNYDFRMLQNFTVSGLVNIAKWAAEPERKDLFDQRCIACKSCVPSGWKFFATSAALNAFFLVQPPPCRTYLTTDYEDPDALSHTFYPPEDDGSEPVDGRMRERMSKKDDGSEPRKSISASGRSPMTGGERPAPPTRHRQKAAAARQRPLPTTTGCWSCLPFVRRRQQELLRMELERREAAKRIRDLEETNQQLSMTCERLEERMSQLEAAVPWAAWPANPFENIAQQFGLDNKQA